MPARKTADSAATLGEEGSLLRKRRKLNIYLVTGNPKRFPTTRKKIV